MEFSGLSLENHSGVSVPVSVALSTTYIRVVNMQRKKCYGAVSLIFKMAGTTFFRLWQPVAAPEMLLALPDWRMILMSELLLRLWRRQR